MINQYPLWKNLLVLLILVLGVIYALPNIYPPDFAVQISAEQSDAVVAPEHLESSKQALNAAGLDYFAAEIADGNAVIRFADGVTQQKAKDLLQDLLSDTPGEYILALNSPPSTPKWLADLGGEPMKYGLDLRGGVHFLLEVDTESVVTKRIEGLIPDVKRLLREKKFRYGIIASPSRGVLKVNVKSASDRDAIKALLESRYDEYTIDIAPDAHTAINMTLSQQSIKSVEDHAISQNLQTLRKRVNELGVSEPLVQRLGKHRIVVDLPGVQDPTAAKKILGKVATLEFRMEVRPDAPRSSGIKFDYEGNTASLERSVILEGDSVIDAQVGFDPDSGLPQVSITLDGKGGESMHRATYKNIGRRLGVVFIETKSVDRNIMVDGVKTVTPARITRKRVISLATVQAALGVKFRITGLSGGEARDLALLLRAGALAADMFIVEERTVGASLGQENVHKGAISIVVGLGLVLLFMLVYYKVFGLAANVALIANITLLIAVMSAIAGTLTLPGIAGIVLTVGMAVDANVLIFSRIKEELTRGTAPQAAIDRGFRHAFTTILDANITTLIVALVLYAIGTGPVKGFAVTLSIGIITSMFTALICSRAIINLIYGGRDIKSLAI